MKTRNALLIALLAHHGGGLSIASAQSQPQSDPPLFSYTSYGRLAEGVPNADPLGWKVGIQTHSIRFNKVTTFFEAVDLTVALGLKYMEAVGLRMSHDTEEAFGSKLSPEWRAKVKQKLADSGVECISYYRRVKGNESAEDAENTFKFCKDMGLMLVTDPVRVPSGIGSMDFYEGLAKKYGVRMVITNHPKAHGSPYWDPDVVLEDLKGRDPLLGASVDLGHFMRDGYEPLEIVKKYIAAGRMYHFHFRDVNGLGPQAKDATLGEGAGKIDEILKLLREKNVKPVMMLEYERDSRNQLVYLIPSVNHLNRALK